MRIAVCLNKYFPYGGMQRDFRGIVHEALDRGHDVNIYTMEWLGDIPSGFQVTLVPVSGITNHLRCWHFSHYIKNVVAKAGYDIVVGFNRLEGLDVYYAADPCYQFYHKKQRNIFNRLNPRYRTLLALEKKIFSAQIHPDILFITEKQRDDYLACYPYLPVTQQYLLPTWIEILSQTAMLSEQRLATRAEFHIQDGMLLILMVGSGFKIKGLQRALYALASLPVELLTHCRFFIIGEDKPTAFQKLAKQLGVSEQVRFLGGRADVPRFMAAADILIHPAYNESAGIVLLEAIFAGLPILVTDTCGFAKYITEAQAGQVIVSPYQQESLNKALYNALSNHQQRQQWSKQAFSYAANMPAISMPQQALDIIERSALKKQHHAVQLLQSSKRCGGTHIELARELIHKWPTDRLFSAIMQTDGELFRNLSNRKTLCFHFNDKNYFIKKHFGVGWREIFKNWLFGRAPVISAKNEYLAIKRLTQLNIPTLETVGYGSEGFNPATHKSFIITRAINNAESLEMITQNWKSQPPVYTFKLALIRRLAEIVSQMHAHGANHRDLYLCHFLLRKSELNNPDLVIIDLHRVQLRDKTPFRWRVKDLGSLYYSALDIGLTRRDLYRFIRHYTHLSLGETWQKHQPLWKASEKWAEALLKRHHKFVPPGKCI